MDFVHVFTSFWRWNRAFYDGKAILDEVVAKVSIDKFAREIEAVTGRYLPYYDSGWGDHAVYEFFDPNPPTRSLK